MHSRLVGLRQILKFLILVLITAAIHLLYFFLEVHVLPLLIHFGRKREKPLVRQGSSSWRAGILGSVNAYLRLLGLLLICQRPERL